MSDFTDDDVTAVRQVVVEYGGDRDETIHSSWRCFDKDRYPEPCDCLDEFSRNVLAAVAPAIAARALREAADAMESEPGVTFADALMIRWLRARAEQVSGDE